MPATRTPVRKQRVTNEQLAAQIDAFEQSFGKRLDSVEALVRDIGLNGDKPLLVEFLKTYKADRDLVAARSLVRADWSQRLRWLAVPRNWLKMLAAAVIGGIGWRIASGGTHGPF